MKILVDILPYGGGCLLQIVALVEWIKMNVLYIGVIIKCFLTIILVSVNGLLSIVNLWNLERKTSNDY